MSTPTNTPARQKLNLYITTKIPSPYNVKSITPFISLDPKRLQIKLPADLQLDSLVLRAEAIEFPYQWDFLLDAYLVRDFRPEKSKEYARYMNGDIMGGLIGREAVDQLINIFREQAISLTRYIGWQKGLGIFDPHGKGITTRWHWHMGSLSGNDQTDRETYRAGQLFRWVHGPVHIDEAGLDRYYVFQEKQLSMPLHHELIGEASKLISVGYERSAFLILYSALEVASKSLIAAKFPDAEWLIENMPSPDLAKLYKEFINEKIFVDDHEEARLSEGDIKQLRELTRKRNVLAHSGNWLSKESMSNHYRTVEGWIKRIDKILGYA